MTVTFLVLAGVVAAVDWVAVARRREFIELAAKPLTLILLIVAASFADVGPAKPWVIIALALGLLGDLALLFSDGSAELVDTAGGVSSAVDVSTADDGADGADGADADGADGAFLVGLASFLLGHIAWIVAFARHGVHSWQLLAGLLVVAGGTSLVLPRVLRGARTAGGDVLAAAVGVYSAALAVMVVFAFGTTAVATAVGGALFLASDATLAWDRFVRRLLRGQVIVMVTYHLAQALLLIGLIRHY
jgi:uncharacterized membrane protein YhhN